MSLQTDGPTTRATILAAVRWVLVLPAAVAGATLIAYVLVRSIGFFADFGVPKMHGWGFDGHWFLGPLYTIAQATISAAGFVIAGSMTAPKKEPVVAIILSTTWGLFLLGMYGIYWVAFYNEDPGARAWSGFIRMTLYFVTGMISVVLSAAFIDEHYGEK